MTPTAEEQAFIEKWGLYYEQAGASRMAGRLLAWLLIANPPAQTAEQIMEALQVSRGAISTAARQVVDMGLAERVSLPGQRADFYQLQTGSWARLLRQGLVQYTRGRLLAEEGLALLADAPAPDRLRLEELQHFFGFWETRMPELLTEWEGEWRQYLRERDEDQK